MRLGALDDKVGGGLARSADLRPNSSITRLERAIPQVWPIGPDGGVEYFAARRVDRIVDRGDPFHIRAEPRLPRQIQGDVYAKPARDRHWIDKPPERRATAKREIDAAAEIGWRDRLGRHSFERMRQRRGIEAGGINQELTADRRRVIAADVKLEAVIQSDAGEHRCA